MLGSATLTTRLSSTTMNRPIETIARVQARLRLVLVGVGGLIGEGEGAGVLLRSHSCIL